MDLGPAREPVESNLYVPAEARWIEPLPDTLIAGDDPAAKATVTDLLDQFGFDTVDAGPLKEGWRIQRDTPGYGPRRNAEELRRDLVAAKRYADT